MSDDVGFGITMTVFILFVVGVVTCPFWIAPLQYHFNQSDCSVWVNKQMVYNGKCHFVDVGPVGEYGNSKRVSIFSDVRKWHQVQKYIAEDVEIKEFIK